MELLKNLQDHASLFRGFGNRFVPVGIGVKQNGKRTKKLLIKGPLSSHNYSVDEVIAWPDVRMIGMKTYEDLLVIDFDGTKGSDFALKRGFDWTGHSSWFVGRTNNTERFKIIYQRTNEQQMFGPIRQIDNKNQIDLFSSNASFVCVAGQHPDGDFFRWEGGGAEELNFCPEDAWAFATGHIDYFNNRNSQAQSLKVITTTSSSSQWKPCRPCTICGRSHDDDCSISSDGTFIQCHQGVTNSPPSLKVGETIEKAGNDWAFCGEGKNAIGTFSKFTIDKPIPLSDGNKPAVGNGKKDPIAEKEQAKPMAERLLKLDEEIDRLFLPDSVIKPLDRITFLREVASRLDLTLRDHDLQRKIWEGRRRAAGAIEMLTPEMTIAAPQEVWLWDQVLMKEDTNLLVALPKLGKTTLLINAISKWYYGSEEFLGQKFNGACPDVIILGTDMARSRWLPLLGRFGLAKKDGTDSWKLLGPIKGLFTMNEPVHLDVIGLSQISEVAAVNQGSLVLLDSYAKCVNPLGISENDAAFAGPLADLQETLAPFRCTPVVIHHAGKAGAEQNPVLASRGSTALPASVSQVIGMKWFKRRQIGS